MRSRGQKLTTLYNPCVVANCEIFIRADAPPCTSATRRIGNGNWSSRLRMSETLAPSATSYSTGKNIILPVTIATRSISTNVTFIAYTRAIKEKEKKTTSETTFGLFSLHSYSQRCGTCFNFWALSLYRAISFYFCYWFYSTCGCPQNWTNLHDAT